MAWMTGGWSGLVPVHGWENPYGKGVCMATVRCGAAGKARGMKGKDIMPENAVFRQVRKDKESRGGPGWICQCKALEGDMPPPYNSLKNFSAASS